MPAFITCFFVSCIVAHCNCWLFRYKPGEYVCTPLNFLCSYSEECCMGVCYQRTYLKFIKIRQCSLGNKIIGFPKEDELNYLATKEIRKLVHDRSTEPGHVKGEIEQLYDEENRKKSEKDESNERINIYKPVNISLSTETPAEKPVACNECEEKKQQEMMMKVAKVSKSSPMYGGPLNMTGNFSVPFDDIHKLFMAPCKDCEKNNSQSVIGNNGQNMPQRSSLPGYEIKHSGDENNNAAGGKKSDFQSGLKNKFNLTDDELKDFEKFNDLKFLKPTLKTTTISPVEKAEGIKKDLESFFMDEGNVK